MRRAGRVAGGNIGEKRAETDRKREGSCWQRNAAGTTEGGKPPKKRGRKKRRKRGAKEQHKKEENRQQNAEERKEEKPEKFAVPDMGLEPMIFSPAAGQIACECSFA
jgi:hypothetical protein